MKKLVLLMIIGIMLSISLLVGVSYALWSNTHIQENGSLVESGCFSTDFSEVNSISLSNSYPISDDKGMSSTPYQFTITNTCTVDAKYEVNFEVLANSTLSSNYVKLAIDNKKDILSNYESKNPTIEGALSSSNIANGWLKPEQSVTYNLRLWIEEATTIEQGEGKVLNGKVVVMGVGDLMPGAEFIESLLVANPETMNNDDPDGNVRYMGANPNNYVTFNNEIWRIIGVFNIDNGVGKFDKRIKLISADTIGSLPWSSDNVNDWSESSLNIYLNEEYFYNLDKYSQDMIDLVSWGIGGTASFYGASDGLTSHWYSYERGNVVYGNNPTKWIGKIALVYPSDYGYATSGGTTMDRKTCLLKELNGWNASEYSECVQNSYLIVNNSVEWVLSHNSGASNNGFCMTNAGNIIYCGDVYGSHSVRPVVYLKPGVKILDGNGTIDNPYALTL